MFYLDTMSSSLPVSLSHRDPIVCAGLAALLADNGVELVPDGHAAQLVITSYADGLARLSGAGATAQEQKILIVTQLDREWDVRRAMAAGAHGYLLQHCSAQDLYVAVRTLARGQRYLSDELSHYMAGSVTQGRLTGRETQVLQLLAQGYCNKIIARELGIGVGTVKTHVRAVFDKLGATARTQAVVLAVRDGLLRKNNLVC